MQLSSGWIVGRGGVCFGSSFTVCTICLLWSVLSLPIVVLGCKINGSGILLGVDLWVFVSRVGWFRCFVFYLVAFSKKLFRIRGHGGREWMVFFRCNLPILICRSQRWNLLILFSVLFVGLMLRRTSSLLVYLSAWSSSLFGRLVEVWGNFESWGGSVQILSQGCGDWFTHFVLMSSIARLVEGVLPLDWCWDSVTATTKAHLLQFNFDGDEKQRTGMFAVSLACIWTGAQWCCV